MEQRILVIGALGQVGSDLVPALRQIYGETRVIASDLKPATDEAGPYVVLDCTDGMALDELVTRARWCHLSPSGAALGYRRADAATSMAS
nr:hypothetical protein [Chloroflexus sp.]